MTRNFSSTGRSIATDDGAASSVPGAQEALAHVLNNRCCDAVLNFLRAGMTPTDAREQTMAEWLMMEPEEY
jgi:hypothetical protein